MFVERIEDNLKQCIIPFWKSMKDEEQGGYYGFMDWEHRIDKSYWKGCILNSRILWFFANASQALGDDTLLPYAEHAFRFLKEHCVDRENGGVYWSVQHDGGVCDGTKHTYNQAFAVYALSSYYDASKDEEALSLAFELYHVIEEKMRDEGGYGEAFTVDFKPEENDKLSENNVIADRTMNTLLHICEAYTELYRVSHDGEVKERLGWVLNEFVDKVYNPRLHRLEVFFDRDMNSILDLHSYGHDIEATWLLDRGLTVLGDEALSNKLAPMIMDLTCQIYSYAYRNHSVMAECEKGVVDTKRIWWVQCESIIGFYNAYQKSGNENFKDAAEDIWNYVEEHMLDSHQGSEWFAEVDEQGEVIPHPIVEPWKCPYHNGRMCFEMMRRGRE